DFKNAFVHAPIDKEIYVKLPPGFINNKSILLNNNKIENYNNINKTMLENKYIVCKLNKALYRLKQSPRL
ncbi:hypothetical protein DM02DRAFT_545802, partial [Periconia macrospinosa]